MQNCAQIDRKCTLFRPKTPFFAHFCRGEGRLFGRPKNGVFGGPGGRARRGASALFVSRFPPQENAPIIEPCSISKIELLHLRNILQEFEIVEIINYLGKVVCFACTVDPMMEGTIQHSGLAERSETCIYLIIYCLSTSRIFFCLSPAQRE